MRRRPSRACAEHLLHRNGDAHVHPVPLMELRTLGDARTTASATAPAETERPLEAPEPGARAHAADAAFAVVHTIGTMGITHIGAAAGLLVGLLCCAGCDNDNKTCSASSPTGSTASCSPSETVNPVPVPSRVGTPPGPDQLPTPTPSLTQPGAPPQGAP
ncbi:hypothetical protein [Streptomyces abikoensis]|uniref:hypothetical protein n=1 Tax=Streptomyces abikoensis TaxID=97398 RepID=UPI003683AE67